MVNWIQGHRENQEILWSSYTELCMMINVLVMRHGAQRYGRRNNRGRGGWGKKCLPYRSNAEQAKNTGWQTNENVPLLQKFTPLRTN